MPSEETWPEELPTPLQARYVVKPTDAKISAKMDDGSVLRRQRFSREVAVYQEMYELSGSDFDSFISWYTFTLENGSLPFTKRILTGGSLVPASARFVGTYQAKLVAPRHLATENLVAC